MWHEVLDLIEHHRSKIHKLVIDFARVQDRLAVPAPDVFDVGACGAVLHSFYGGIEQIMRTVAEGVDGGLKKSPEWHKELLDAMAAAKPNRPALWSNSTATVLDEYRQFRHRFRNLYSFDLDWSRMKPLADALASTWAAADADLNRFLAAVARTPGDPPPDR